MIFIFTTLLIFNQNIPEISPNEAYYNLLKSKNEIILIDVRSKDELDSIKIHNILNIDFYSSDFKNNILSLDPNYTYYMICRSGRRSGIATEFMLDNGFKSVSNISGGLLEWVRLDLELNIKKGHLK